MTKKKQLETAYYMADCCRLQKNTAPSAKQWKYWVAREIAWKKRAIVIRESIKGK